MCLVGAAYRCRLPLLFPGGGAQVVPGTTPDPKKDPERKVRRASRWIFPE